MSTAFVKSVQLQLFTAEEVTMLKWVMLIYSIYNITMSGTVGLPMSTDDATQDIKSILASKVVCIKNKYLHSSKVRVDPFFRDLVQFTILLPLKDLSSVHNPYLLAMKNMITIRSRSFFFKQKIENIAEI